MDFTLKCYVSRSKGLSCLVSYLVNTRSCPLPLMLQHFLDFLVEPCPCSMFSLSPRPALMATGLLGAPKNHIRGHLIPLSSCRLWSKSLFETGKPCVCECPVGREAAACAGDAALMGELGRCCRSTVPSGKRPSGPVHAETVLPCAETWTLVPTQAQKALSSPERAPAVTPGDN